MRNDEETPQKQPNRKEGVPAKDRKCYKCGAEIRDLKTCPKCLAAQP